MQNNDSNIIKTVLVVQYQIRVFDDLNLAFSKPFEVTNEFDRSLNNRSNKTDLNHFFPALHSYLAPIGKRYTHTSTPLYSMLHSYLELDLLMLHSYRDPILKNVIQLKSTNGGF